MGDLETALRESLDEYGARLRRALFGTTDAGTIAAAIERFVAERLGPIESCVFVRCGVGLVVGVELADARRVVLKVHRWNVTVERLSAVQEVQAALAAAGLPAPAPLIAPATLGTGIATAEDLLDGDSADGHDPTVRRSVAELLAELVSAAGAIEPPPAVGERALRPAGDQLWGEPHDLRFDFEATAAGAEWIDDLARHARAELDWVTLSNRVVHLDWRVENLAFAGSAIVGIYDWDSIGSAPEAVAVGQAAAQFSTDWSRGGFATLPTVDEMCAFVDDYERARGRSFTEPERRAADAANLWLCAYGARCQHSDRTLHPAAAGEPGEGWAALLRARGTTALTGRR